MISNKSLYKIHSWLGLNLGLILFVICFSGTIAVFSSDIDWLSNPSMRIEPSDQPIAWGKMVESVRSEFPNGTNLGLYKETFTGSGRSFATVAYVSIPNGQIRKVYLNPYSGAIQGHTSFFNVQRFFRTFHRRFFDGNRGIILVTLTSFFLLFSVITGFLFYKGWLKNLFRLRIRDGLKRFFSDAHKLAGIWTLLFGLLIALTGIFYFTELMISASGKGEVLLPDGPPELSLNELIPADSPHPNIADVDAVIQNAQQAFPELEIMSLRIPIEPTDYFFVDGQAGNPFTRDRANKVYLHPITGKVAHIQYSSELNTAQLITDIADPLHFGTFGGMITKIIWFIFGLALCFSILSGMYIWQIRTLQKHQALVKKSKIKNSAPPGLLKRLNQKKSVLISVAIILGYFLHVSISTISGIRGFSPQNKILYSQTDTLRSDNFRAELTQRLIQGDAEEYGELEIRIQSSSLLPIQSVELINKAEDSTSGSIKADRRGHPGQHLFAVTGLGPEVRGEFRVQISGQPPVVFPPLSVEFGRSDSSNQVSSAGKHFPKAPAGVWITVILFSTLTIGIIIFWTVLVLKPVMQTKIQA